MENIELHLTDFEPNKMGEEDRFQIWATKLGNPDKEGIPSHIEVELWRVENGDAPEDRREAKKIKTVRFVPIVIVEGSENEN